MEKRSCSVVLSAAFVYFVLLGFTEGQFFPGKVFIIILIIFLFHVFEVGFIFIVCCFARKTKTKQNKKTQKTKEKSAWRLNVFTDKLEMSDCRNAVHLILDVTTDFFLTLLVAR